MGPLMLVQMLQELIANGRIRNWYLQCLPSAGYGLDEIGSTKDAGQLAILYDWHPLDRVLFQEGRNFMQRCVRRGSNHMAGHDIGDLPRMCLGVFGCKRFI